MGGGEKKQDVDAIWKQLKQQQSGTKDNPRLESLWKHVQRGITNKQSQQKPAATQDLCQLQLLSSATCSSSSSSAQQSCDALRNNLQDASAVNKLIQALQSRECCIVKAALQELQASLAGAAAGSIRSTAKLGKALLRCFDHRAEACRDLSVDCFIRLLQLDPDATLSMLPYALPVLGERLQCDEAHNPAEPSEDVRLKLVQLLSLTLDHAGSAVAAYASEVWSMLTAVLVDAFHEVAMQGCKVSQQLSGALGYRLGNTSKELIAALLPLTTHKRYRVRIAAIEAVKDVMHQGAHEMILEMVAWRDPNLVPIKAFYGDDIKVNFCGKLATDHHVQVRLAFLDMVGNWMLTLRERLDHEPRLLPYILTGLCDEAPAVVTAALQLLDQLGQQYEQEHKKDLAGLVRFAGKVEGEAEARLLQLMADGHVCYAGSWETVEQPDHTAEDAIQPTSQHPCTTQQSTAHAAAGSCAIGEPFVLPGPFKQRMRLGSRLLVRADFSSLLPALCRELSSWQSGPRAMSARLLLVSLVLVESAAEQHLQAILPALCVAVDDVDAGAAARGCAAVLGCFCSLPLLLDLLAPRLEDWTETPKRQAAGLLLLAAVLRGANPLARIAGHGPKLLQLLVDLGVTDSRDSSVQAALHQLVQQLLVPHTLKQLGVCSCSCSCTCGLPSRPSEHCSGLAVQLNASQAGTLGGLIALSSHCCCCGSTNNSQSQAGDDCDGSEPAMV